MKRALLLGVGTLLFPSLLRAQSAGGGAQAGLDPNAPPPAVHVVDDAEPLPPIVPRAKDLLGSHVLVGAAVAPVWSFGHLGSDETVGHGLGTGFGLHADLGFGLSRSVVLGAWGTFASYADGDRCASCAGKALAVGPFVRYQLSQGLRFDPWLMLGGGYRQLSFADQSGARQKFSGVEWLRLELGADYYVFSGFGLGPYASLGLSSYGSRPSTAGSAGVNTELSAGLRLLLDLPGR
jgi:hypothetical protein